MNFSSQMSERRFLTMSDIDAKRFGAVPERELFETKLLHLALPKKKEQPVKKNKNILTIMRDPGNTLGLLPLAGVLLSKGYDIDVLSDNRGLEYLKKYDGVDANEIFEGESPLNAQTLSPDLLLLHRTTSEQGLENFELGTFDDVPVVFIEDMYGSAERFISMLEERPGLKGAINRVKKICVNDQFAADDLKKRYPDLAGKIVITGQPLYDRLIIQNREEVTNSVRNGLQIDRDAVVVTFFGAASNDKVSQTPNTTEVLEAIIQEFKKIDLGKIRFIFRNHPRDLISGEQYESILKNLGELAVDIVDANKFSTDQVGIASDVVISLPFSTITYDALYRDKPTVVLMDKSSEEEAGTIPAIESGAAVGVSEMSQFGKIIAQLVDKKSELNKKLKIERERWFKLDGKNTERVSEIVEQVLEI